MEVEANVVASRNDARFIDSDDVGGEKAGRSWTKYERIVLRRQSMTGLMDSSHGMPRITECMPMGAT